MLWRGFQKLLMEGKAVSGGLSLEPFLDGYVTQKERKKEQTGLHFKVNEWKCFLTSYQHPVFFTFPRRRFQHLDSDAIWEDVVLDDKWLIIWRSSWLEQGSY